MSKKSFSEILEKIKSVCGSVYEFAHEDYDPNDFGLGPCTEVKQYGGEGKGDKWYSIKYFKDHDVYIRVDGYYQSYNGAEFEGWKSCKEVKPEEKLITVYE